LTFLLNVGGENQEMENDVTASARELIALLSSSDDFVRTGARRSLVAIGRPAVPLLIEALKKPDGIVRWEAAKALGAIGDPSTAQALVEALEDEEFEVRWRAAEGLTEMGAEGLRPLLHALIRAADSVSLREGAYHVLRKVAKGKIKDCLVPVLTSLKSTWPSLDVPVAALRAIEMLEESEKTHEEKDAPPFKGTDAATSNQPALMGDRMRAKRYARSLRYGGTTSLARG
jgi:HEAT repeat protein